MKAKLILLTLLVSFFSINAQIKTPKLSPSCKLEQTVGQTNVTLEYSRPSKRGRIVMGELVPFGKKWRTGANENTKITFSTDVIINGQTLNKGTYAIYTIPNKNSWEIIFYKDHNNWGLPKKWENSKVALKTKVSVRNLPDFLETFRISFDDLSDLNSFKMSIAWENTLVPVKIEVPTEKIALESIDRVMAGPSVNDYYGAASYYYTIGKDKKQALEWINKAIEMKPDAFWMLQKKSMIQADLGDKEGAIKTAQKSMELAQKSGNTDYVKKNKDFIAIWKN